MSTRNLRLIRHIAGRLIANPTDLSAGFDAAYGGTFLGLSRNNIIMIGRGREKIDKEEWGGAVVDFIVGPEIAMLTCVLRGFDNDVIAAVFRNTATGAKSGDTIINRTADTAGRGGYLASEKALKLLFAPLAPDHHEAVLLFNAIPSVLPEAQLEMGLDAEVGIAVEFLGAPDGTGRISQVGKIQDLTL